MSLKSALRQLYKRVHPDLFTDYPAEQVSSDKLALPSTCVHHPCLSAAGNSNAYIVRTSCRDCVALLDAVAIVPMQAENERSFKLLQVSSLQCSRYKPAETACSQQQHCLSAPRN
jgi:hypothetical protein